MKLRSGGLGLQKREDRPAAFAVRSTSRLFQTRDTCRAYAVEYPIPSRLTFPINGDAARPNDFEKPAGKDREKGGGENREALHSGSIAARVFATLQ